MTALGDLLIRRIAATGPMTLADYMAECLLHPEHGYYTTRAPFGAAGDFTTAPEISQMFGEVLGLALAQSWLDQGAPAPFTLAEIGPGRGTLMADILRATRAVPGFLAAARVTLVEASPRLRALQRETLGAQAVIWAEDVAALPDAPLFLIANEFFDALPIRQFTRTQAGWCETMVGVSDGKLCLGAGPSARLGQLEHRLQDTTPGEIVEICPAAPGIIGAIAARIATHGGAAMVIDYGDWRSRGDTFQAMAGHGYTDPLAAPGQADLTAHVDFEALALAAAGCRVSPLVPQGVLLERLGITDRARQLAQRMADDSLRAHIAAHRRLTHPEEMGTLFKALALFAPQAAPPPGFE